MVAYHFYEMCKRYIQCTLYNVQCTFYILYKYNVHCTIYVQTRTHITHTHTHIPYLHTVMVDTIRHILLTKTTAAQNEDALSYRSVRGLHFLAVVFTASIITGVYGIIKVVRCYGSYCDSCLN